MTVLGEVTEYLAKSSDRWARACVQRTQRGWNRDAFVRGGDASTEAFFLFGISPEGLEGGVRTSSFRLE